MKTKNNGTTAAKVNNNESNNRVNNVAMPAGEYGDLCYDYFGKSSVIVFGNTDDHAAQLEAIGGKYSDRLKYSPLQNGRKWTEKQGRTAGYYFTTEQGKREAVQYVQRVNHAIFDRYEQSTEGGEHLRQKPADFKEGDRVRTIHGLGTVTANEPQYNKAVSVCVRLDKMTYNYAWKGMPHTFIECRCDEITRYTEAEKLSDPKKGTADYYRERLSAETWDEETMYFEFLDVHHDCSVEVHRPTNDGTPTGDRWQTDIKVWGDPTYDGCDRKEDAKPCTTFRTLDDLCEHLAFLYDVSIKPEELSDWSRNRYDLERCKERPTAWVTDYTADDFRKLQSTHEISDDDRDIMGRRFRTEHDDIFALSVFVSDYAGNEAHALIYIYDELMDKVSANVLPIDKLRTVLTEARGWHKVAA